MTQQWKHGTVEVTKVEVEEQRGFQPARSINSRPTHSSSADCVQVLHRPPRWGTPLVGQWVLASTTRKPQAFMLQSSVAYAFLG